MKHITTAIICAVKTYETQDIEYELRELKGLANAQNIEVKDKIYQSLNYPDPKTYLGSGKILELKKMIDILKVDLVIFNDTLSPSQIKTLDQLLDVEIVDRSFLILNIFASRAQTKIAKLEVSLAQKSYMLPRLVGLGKSLSRQGGGTFNAKGPGETKLEMDRRKLLEEIHKIKNRLEIAQKEKKIASKKRRSSKTPVVALIGYTNVGKSSLINALSSVLNNQDNVVFEKDMLFATLDTKTLSLAKEGYPNFLLIDTVGFVSKLPHELINSFKSTLSDLEDANLIIHVIDGAYYNESQIHVTNQILTSLELNHIPKIYAVTKKDIKPFDDINSLNYINISNKTYENIDILVDEIYANIYNDYRIFHIKVNFDEFDLISVLHKNFFVVKQETYNDYYLLTIYTTYENISKIKNMQ